MTDRPQQFCRERAAEIVAAYGGDAARWPDDERAGALAIVAADPALAAARHEAAAVDAMLRDWAQAPVAAGDSFTVAAAAMRHRSVATVRRWMAGGGVAAALGFGLLLVDPATSPTVVPTVATTTVTDAQAFAGVFTLTLDEENNL